MSATGEVPVIRLGRLPLFFLAVGVVGIVAWALGFLWDPTQAWFAYLTAYCFGVSIALGGLWALMVTYAATSDWFVVMRRLPEAVASTLPLFLLLFVPLIFGLGRLYPWVPPLHLSESMRAAVEKKQAWLDPTFFVLRGFGCLVVWNLLAFFLLRWSRRQDEEPGLNLRARLIGLGAAGLVIMLFTQSFAAFDWMMSLEPDFSSTVYGMYWFCGSFEAGAALTAILLWRAATRGPLDGRIRADHAGGVGKLMLVATILWAYAAFAQLLIIWIADVPEEARWYVIRTYGSWRAIFGVLAAGKFLLPFLLLLSWGLKRTLPAIAAVGAWMLVMQYVDTAWLVLPALHPGGVRPNWLDLAAAVGVLGLAAAWGAWWLDGRAAVPVGDPLLPKSMEYSHE